ncbi:phosphate transport regulator [Ramlibacter sp. RBP-2]|uniref:Phosphate transport regulator n=1 Tax=Ramlibacter lithotrophicus TaxID=2606681 RepID=A0A7X6DCK2_9BURK|nr:phosphate transport regulator [Ramlibacter lithotrophicus]NKE64692.1 phosphate transport regulator [Ramlibacter lithotrophicus]
MRKTQAVSSLGEHRLMLPAWVKAALAANDRLKGYLTVFQTASAHAAHPAGEVPDLAREFAAAGLDGAWLHDVAAAARKVDDDLLLPDMPRLVRGLEEDLGTMARPVVETAGDSADAARVKHWLDWLRALPADRLSARHVDALTRGRRGDGDSVHLLVMDLHKQINKLAGELASEVIDGANVWDLQPQDRTRVAAFMRGLNRTAALKFDHPGLDTAATRDGERLLLQNDIGTNDAHVLVLQVADRTITLTYSDLHRIRFEFFQSLLVPFGAKWSQVQSRTDAALNQGAAYSVGTAQFDCADEAALEAALEGIGSRIVFLIDWNRARKRLQAFVGKDEAIAVLAEAARLDIGHRAWLQAGGERLVFAAMQAAGEGAFQIGDRLDEVIGNADAHAFLLAVMQLACDALRRGQPAALVADETRMLLPQHVRQRTSEFDLLAEHAAYCHSLAQAVSDGLAHGAERSGKASRELATRAKAWERRADHLVMQAREKAERQPRWRPVARMMEQSDDVADALEEAAFLISLTAEQHVNGWNDNVRKLLARLAATVLQATQDQVKALAIARTLSATSEAMDNDAFLRATWRVLQAERQCDSLLRDARRVIIGAVRDAPSLMLANDLACVLELTSDRQLAAAYALRDLAFDKAGVRG